jgi:hypothetical protein
MGYTIAAQLICHNLPWLTTVIAYQAPEEALCCSSITFGLKINIDHITILIHCPP